MDDYEDDTPPFHFHQPESLEEQKENDEAWNQHFARLRDPVDVHGANHEKNRHPPTEVTVEKKKRVIPEEKKELPAELKGFRFEHKDKLVCAEEIDRSASKRGEGQDCLVKVARHIIARAGKPNEKKWDLQDLNSHQIRRLALNFGCSKVGSSSKFECRRQMALKVDGGTTYGNLDIPNPTSTAKDKKVNTAMRILNAVFSPSLVDGFLTLNDQKKRADFEAASGNSPHKEFWKDVSNMVNDSESNRELSVVLDSMEDENERLYIACFEELINLTDCVQQTHETCKQHILDAMKARQRCMEARASTGNHDNDLWGYCVNAKWTKLRKKDPPVPAIVVYYCDVLCLKYPKIDASFTESLGEAFRSDSTGVPSSGGSVKSTTSSSSRASLIASFQNCMTDVQQKTSTSAAHRQAILDLKKRKVDEELESKNWIECSEACERFDRLLSARTCMTLCRNLSKRILQLEEKLNIPQSESVTVATEFFPTAEPEAGNHQQEDE